MLYLVAVFFFYSFNQCEFVYGVCDLIGINLKILVCFFVYLCLSLFSNCSFVFKQVFIWYIEPSSQNIDL